MTQEFSEFDKFELPQYDKNTTLPHLVPQGASVTDRKTNKQTKSENS